MDKRLNGKRITIEESYKVMYEFLKGYYKRLGKPESLATLLGGFRLHKDGVPVDPAAWEDWLDAVQKVVIDETEKK